jgi:hypothetical protein
MAECEKRDDNDHDDGDNGDGGDHDDKDNDNDHHRHPHAARQVHGRDKTQRQNDDQSETRGRTAGNVSGMQGAAIHRGGHSSHGAVRVCVRACVRACAALHLPSVPLPTSPVYKNLRTVENTSASMPWILTSGVPGSDVKLLKNEEPEAASTLRCACVRSAGVRREVHSKGQQHAA